MQNFSIFFFIIVMTMTIGANAQIVTADDFKTYNINQFDSNGDGKADYVEAALTIKDLYGLDKNNAISRSLIIDSIPKTKEQIYIEVNNWFVHSFNSGKSVIQMNDKDAGVIIGKGFVSNVATHTSFTSNANVHAWIIIRVDIRESRMRITTTVQTYELDMGSGVLGAFGGNTSTTRVEWLPVDCFPYNAKNYKKTTSKAFVNCHIYSLVLADKLSEAVLHGITGTESDW
jgi:hypothetical protein